MIRIKFTGLLAQLILLALCLGVANAQAASRHALVIGNASYADSPLDNTTNDATDVAQALAGLGYQVFGGGAQLDLSLEQMEEQLSDFADTLDSRSVALVYFAGHGASVNNETYLVPVGSRVRKASQIKHRALSLSYLMDTLGDENKDGLNIILLDACRNNPFGRGLRTESRGLARPSRVPHGTFVGLAADRGQVASDGSGRNGLYTKHLLAQLRSEPSQEIEDLHKQIAELVYRESAGSDHPQRPVYQSSFFGRYCLADCQSQSLSTENEPEPEGIAPPTTGRLWVKTEPDGARVRIMNIKPKYSDGIELALGGSYNVLVSHQGYESWRRDVELKQTEQVVAAVLEKLPEVKPAVVIEPEPKPRARLPFEPEMVDIPAGNFRMGDLNGGGADDEKPVHRVSIKGFKLAKTEVTFAQYDAFAAATGREMPEDEGWGRANGRSLT